jgi:transcriptional regulator with XRE-family HTH domain
MANRQRGRVLSQFGRALAELRRAAGLSQEELAALSGLHRTYVGGLERAERNPTITTLVALAKGLGAKPSDLLEAAGL